MKLIVKTMMFALAAVWLSGTAAQVHAADKYVTDVVYVPLRAGPGNKYRILHQGLKTGARMTVLEENAGEGFTRVRMSNGTEGFIRTQYLMDSQPARDQLPKEQKKNQQLSAQLKQLQAELQQQEAELQSARNNLKNTSTMLDEKTTELVSLREATAEPLALDRRNKQLMEENLRYKNRVEVVEAENAQLVRNNSIRWYLYGGGTILIGILLGLFLPMVKLRKKPSSDWV
ncbi:TIGR04211 family SH3 domain-containing protein [Endozoicomonas euniceicola]|uniref:TIGR04211 family SH3 domain-containing protein n=1 Tax=Endozoicomonas euniceicola TaxID=1234143 RepID=A0ABY6GRR4_9GAMM|nr:TIGR04211 family SH3 domain-containing protein [Endozoicomonas euniceicola]UYM15440.1 TIGR04211 family SH3 domain-containing protein [Endozoicomonas euniceicola]